MTMTRSDSSVTYEPDGFMERYAVPFPVFSADSVHAVLVEGYTERPLTGFSVEGMDTEGGVYVRFFTPPPSGPKLVIYRWTKRVQETDYPEGGRFPSKTVEQNLDKLTAMAQEEEDLLETVLRMPRDTSQTATEYLASFFQAAEEALSARDTASEAAQNASSSALEAEKSEENAAASALDAAKSANEAAEILLQGLPDASEIRKGIFRIATQEESEARKTEANGPAALVPESLFDATATRTGLAKGDEVTVKTGPGGVLSVPGAFVGDIRLLPYRAAELPFGWYFCNGDLYPLESAAGGALNKLSASYKADWGVTVSGSTISIPNMFYTDGRGYFLRADVSPGTIVGDAMRNFTGRFRQTTSTGPSGIFYNGGGAGAIDVAGSRDTSIWVYMDPSRQVPVASENRPPYRTATPAIFLGV